MAAKSKNKKHINLLPKSDFELSASGRILKWALTTFRMIVIGVELVVITGFLSRFWLDIQNSDLDDELQQKENLVKSYSTFEADFREIQSKLIDLKTITNPNNYALESLELVTGRIPHDIALVNVEKRDNVITIQGDSTSEYSIAALIQGLQQIDNLESVSLTKIEYDQRNSLINFSLEVVLDRLEEV